MNIFYKDELHKEQTELLLNKFGISSIQEDLYYGTFSYIVGATYKTKHIAKAIYDRQIDVDEIYETIKVYSSSEKYMIRFALQCFNGSIDEIKLSDVMHSLDDVNTKIVKQAINIRY